MYTVGQRVVTIAGEGVITFADTRRKLVVIDSHPHMPIHWNDIQEVILEIAPTKKRRLFR